MNIDRVWLAHIAYPHNRDMLECLFSRVHHFWSFRNLFSLFSSIVKPVHRHWVEVRVNRQLKINSFLQRRTPIALHFLLYTFYMRTVLSMELFEDLNLFAITYRSHAM